LAGRKEIRMDYRTVSGINLKRLSKEAKVNYEEVGMAVNRKSGTIQAWVSGRSDPEIGILPKLADFFSVRRLEDGFRLMIFLIGDLRVISVGAFRSKDRSAPFCFWKICSTIM